MMAKKQDDSYQRRGATTGSSQRPAEHLAGLLLTFDLAHELERLRREPSYQQGSRNADTLVHEPDFRIVLVAMKPGGRLQEHHAAARISVQTLAGRVRLQLLDRTVDLPAGHLLALESSIEHDVEALEESAFLLTIAWPEGQDARG
jgi:quercetin dioxygenase-like cupin family protein